jgi:hypothetical protein
MKSLYSLAVVGYKDFEIKTNADVIFEIVTVEKTQASFPHKFTIGYNRFDGIFSEKTDKPVNKIDSLLAV